MVSLKLQFVVDIRTAARARLDCSANLRARTQARAPQASSGVARVVHERVKSKVPMSYATD